MSSQSYFEMKQMRIEQNHCAMKVSTDACIQGAWSAMPDNCSSVLDIGTGTGLLSLMLAQKSTQIEIDAVELDTMAANQAKENVAQSIFAKQIKVVEGNILNWASEKKYDFIICNPPFFTNSLQGPNKQKNIARHNVELSLNTLVAKIFELLKEDGLASVLLPISEQQYFELELKKEKLQVVKRLLIKPFKDRAANRCVFIFSKKVLKKIVEEELIIYSSPKVYTEQFSLLMKPFYLHL